LSKDLGIDWRAGAEWFQFLLEDHCVGANWGNWLYFSGVGSDPKQRHFRTVSQALKYDPDGGYVSKWLPKLGEISGKEAHLRPWDYDSVAWKEPIVSPQSQYTWHDYKRLTEEGTLIVDSSR
jgi:deoxyribodipyrimidine photo-lyase